MAGDRYTADAALRAAFADIDTWIFDLDNTLYPAACNLFAEIDTRMTDFIEDRLGCDRAHARFLQKDWYARHGTTLAGLMIEHDVPPDDFLRHVHDIDLSPVLPNPALGRALSALPGRRLIFTNGSVAHAERVADRLGITDLFEGIFDIAAGDYTPKPRRATYDIFGGRFGIEPRTSAFFEDMAANLEVPHALGMRTVLVASEADWFADEPKEKRPARPGDSHPHVDHVTADLTGFLPRLTRRPSSPLQPESRSSRE